MTDEESARARAWQAFGEWFLSEMKSSVHFESSGWATERVDRVQQRLESGRLAKEKLKVLVPWLEISTAFAVPGPYIYFSRRLLEICRTDEMAAFVVAHEIAHHDLGHVDIFPEWIMEYTGQYFAPLMMSLCRNLEKRLYGPEWECAADRYALDLCKSVGYEPTLCLEVFDILEKVTTDLGDLDMVFGPQEQDHELSESASLTTKLRVWFFQMSRGYLPIRDRRQMLIDYLAAMTA